jgi:uncharacterized protein YndB with AHSA1/START domain
MSHSIDVSLPDSRSVRVTRRFDAPARLVFDCHTKPELVKRWLTGPDGWSMPVCEIDLRVGGTYRYTWRNDADGSEFSATGVWKEIAAPGRLVHVERMEGFDGECLCTWTAEEEGGATVMTMTMEFPSEEARDGAVKTGMTDGMGASYDRLDAVLTEKAA